MASLLDEHTQFTDESTRALVNNGFIYIGDDTLDPVANPQTIYSDRALTSALTNPQRTGADGRSVNKIFVTGRYSIEVQDENNVQLLQSLTAGELSQTGISTLGNVSGTNTITADGSPTVTSLVDGQVFNFIAVGTVTGAVTLQIDATSALAVLKFHDQPMVANDWEANQAITVIYNDTDTVFELISNTAAHNFPTDVNTTGTFNPTGITAAGDSAAVGFNNSAGLVLTGQGSISDVALRNDANVTVATIPTGTARFLLNGGQLEFPANQNASSGVNTLDDYEEGEFTATLTPSTSGTITLDSSVDTLAYTKIGRVVYIQGQLQITSVSSPIGDIALTTLPFAPANLIDNRGFTRSFVACAGLSSALVNFAVAQIVESSTSMTIEEDDGSSPTNTLANKTQASASFYFNFSYIAA